MKQFCYKTILAFTLGALLSSCNKKQETPDWEAASPPQYAEPTPPKVIPPKVDDPIQQVKVVTTSNINTKDKPLRFVSYNLRNYLTMRRGSSDQFKPEHEIKALIDNIVRANPDILGVCEIGTQKDLDHLQTRLKKAGIDFQHTFLSSGPDPYRRQALLSHYPINMHNVPKYTYKMKGQDHEIRRGILDATVQTPKGNIRFLGAHLKSKRPIAEYDEAVIRREEAQLLRSHASAVLSDPNRKVLVFGDMNDTKGSSTIRLMRGSKASKLTAIELFDKQGTKWTQYWAREDIYSRFDFAFASPALLPSIDQKGSYVLDTPPGDPASDHRALVIIIK
ncbi:MAG: endonuclease/exonuclease/phosphatase family protein [Akkermansiaceae bacterium]